MFWQLPSIHYYCIREPPPCHDIKRPNFKNSYSHFTLCALEHYRGRDSTLRDLHVSTPAAWVDFVLVYSFLGTWIFVTGRFGGSRY